MAEKKYVIAVDSGTQSVRAIIFDCEGNEVAVSQVQHEPYFSLNPGWAEQNTDDYWSCFCQVTKAAMEKSGVDPKLIAGLGITTQRTTCVPVDRDGKALRPAIIWLDQRKVENPPPLSFAAKALFGAAGLYEIIRYVRKNSKFLWIKQNEPEIYKKTYKFMQISGWLVKRLTGEYKDSVGMVTGLWPLDFKRLKWESMGIAYEAFGLEREHMVDIYPPDTILGQVSAAASAETSLPVGLPVVVGAGDKQSELLGAGGIDPGIGVISFGTATCMDVITRKFVSDKSLRYFTWPGAVPRTWNIEMFIYRGFWMVTWFKQEFGYRESLEAEKRGIAPEVILDEIIRTIPAGSMGLMLQPHWTPMTSSKYNKGSIIGFGDVHTRAHIYHAIPDPFIISKFFADCFSHPNPNTHSIFAAKPDIFIDSYADAFSYFLTYSISKAELNSKSNADFNFESVSVPSRGLVEWVRFYRSDNKCNANIRAVVWRTVAT